MLEIAKPDDARFTCGHGAPPRKSTLRVGWADGAAPWWLSPEYMTATEVQEVRARAEGKGQGYGWLLR